MPKVTLEIKASLENVKSLRLVEPFIFRIRQTGGTEERDNVEVDSSNQEELFGSKGAANFKLKWDKKDKHEAYVNVVSQKEYSGDDVWKPVATFETRGVDLVEWKPSAANVEAKSGVPFPLADLSDPDGFADYDERNECQVSVTNLEYRFKVA